MRSLTSSFVLIACLLATIHMSNAALFHAVEVSVSANERLVLTDFETFNSYDFGLPSGFQINEIVFHNSIGGLTPNVNITLWYGSGSDKNIVPASAGISTNAINELGEVHWTPEYGMIDSSWYGQVSILTTDNMTGQIDIFIYGNFNWRQCVVDTE